MASKLTLCQYIDLPPRSEGDFDHGDVYLPNGHVFIPRQYEGLHRRSGWWGGRIRVSSTWSTRRP